jgi:AcrR family transcriptional regulator
MTTAPARQRIIDAALALVVEGGYEALQVRAITERAAVSSRTIYTFFPSLDSLLIIAIAERAGGEVYRRLTRGSSRKRSPAGRVEEVIDDLIRIMTDNRALTVGLLRALLSGKPDVAQHVRGFAATTQAVLATAIRPEGPRAVDRETAEILEAIYFSALIGWATGADTEAKLRTIMHRAITRILRTP